jgi:hypothetical protein
MNDTKTRLIEAAVRPLADDAELQLAAAQFLGDHVFVNDSEAEQAIKRWQGLDAKRRPSVWRITLTMLLLVVSAMVLVRVFSEFKRLQIFGNIISTMGDGSALPEAAPVLPGKKSLTEAERFILYGDESQSSKTGKAKGVWDRYPQNPAYFAQYAEAYLSEHEKLPDDFLANARKVDPDNAWFLYMAAGVEARDCVKKKTQSAKAKAGGEAPEWEILDAGRLEKAIRLIHEARILRSCKDYKYDLLREKIPLLAQGDKFEWIRSIAHLAGMTSSDVISMRRVGDVISAQAGLLGLKKNTDGFRGLMADSDAFVQKIVSIEPSTVVAGLVYWVNVSTACQGLAGGAKALDIHPEAENYQVIHDRMTEARESLKKRGLLIDGVEFGKEAAFLPAMTIPMVNRQVANPPAISDGDLKPGRLMEHEIASMACAVICFVLLGICLGSVWVSRSFRRSLVRRLAGRFESLMLPVDWMWVMGIGVILPVLFVMGINRFTPLGGRDLSLFGMKFFLPLAHFNTLLLLLLILPVLVSRWRLSQRCGSFGFVWRRAWMGWLAAGSSVAYMIIIGYAAPLGLVAWMKAASAFHLISYLWLIVVIVRACFTKPARSVVSETVARVLVPAYAGAMLLMICLVPVFKVQEEYWFRRDHFMSLDAKYPGVGTYEYKVAVQLQKETRALLGDLAK